MKGIRVFLLVVLFGFIVVPASFSQDMSEFQKQMMQQMMEKNRGNIQSGGGQPPSDISAPGPESNEAANQGRIIFNDSSLGNNGKSCGSCHQEGEKPLAGHKVNNRTVAYVQYCYEHAVGGKKVIAKVKLDKLMAYLRSLQKSASGGIPMGSPMGESMGSQMGSPPSSPHGEEESW